MLRTMSQPLQENYLHNVTTTVKKSVTNTAMDKMTTTVKKFNGTMSLTAMLEIRHNHVVDKDTHSSVVVT